MTVAAAGWPTEEPDEPVELTGWWDGPDGKRHNWERSGLGRVPRCRFVPADTMADTAVGEKCPVCAAMDHGDELADELGANVHRAPDPGALSSPEVR